MRPVARCDPPSGLKGPRCPHITTHKLRVTDTNTVSGAWYLCDDHTVRAALWLEDQWPGADIRKEEL